MTAVATPVNHFPDAHSATCREGMACGHPAAFCTCLAKDFVAIIEGELYQLDVADAEQVIVIRGGAGLWSYMLRSDSYACDWYHGLGYRCAEDAIEAALDVFEQWRGEAQG